MDTTELEAPRYRVGPNWIPVNQVLEPPGYEFHTAGKPPFGVEPINEAARRITDYFRLHQFNAFATETPFDRVHGRWLLLEPDRDFRSVAVRIVPPDEVLPGMPKWKSLRDFSDDVLAPRRQFPHHLVTVGAEIVCITWPRNFSVGWDFDPANEAAEKVAEYHAAHENDRAILESPWDWYTRSLYLPPLGEAKVSTTPEPAHVQTVGGIGATTVRAPSRLEGARRPIGGA